MFCSTFSRPHLAFRRRTVRSDVWKRRQVEAFSIGLGRSWTLQRDYSSEIIDRLIRLGLMDSNLNPFEERGKQSSKSELLAWTNKRGWNVLCWYDDLYQYTDDFEDDLLHGD